MSTQATPLAPNPAATTPITAAVTPVSTPDINTPAPQIQQAPRNELGQFTAPVAAPPVVPAPVAAPSLNPNEAQSPYVLTTLDGGQVEIKYATGETFKGTQQEVLDKIARAHINTKVWAQSRNQPEPVQPQVPASPFANPEEKAAADVVAGLFAKQLGFGSADEMQAAFQSMQQASSQFQQKSLAADFFAAEPTFNDTPENSNKLTEVFVQAYPDEKPTLAKLRMAHAYCLQNQIYQPRAAQQTQNIQAPPPIVTGGSSVTNVAETPNINWPAEKIAEFIRNNPQR